jgi:putative salt-induced outer membrane protein
MNPNAFTTATLLCTCAASVMLAQAPKTSFSGDLGVIDASGNTRLRTISVGDKLAHTRGAWVLTQLGAYVYGETSDSATANQLRASGRADYLFRPTVSVFTGASYERNVFAGFTRRTDEIAGLSWKALGAVRDTLSVDGGGVLTQEADVDGTSRNFPAGRLAGNFKHAFTKASYFQQLAEYLPDLQSTGEYRLNTESAIVAPLSSHAGIKIGYAVRYNSAPPTGFGTSDRVLTTGIQVSF